MPAAQGAGDVRVGEVVDVAQGQRGALARGQAVQEREAPGRPAVVRRRRVVPGALGLAAPARAARLAQRGAHGDAVDQASSATGSRSEPARRTAVMATSWAMSAAASAVAEDAERGAPGDLQRAAGHVLVGEGVGAAHGARPGVVDGGHCLLGARPRPRMLHAVGRFI